MTDYVNFEAVTHKVMRLAGYSPNKLSKVHPTKVAADKKHGLEESVQQEGGDWAWINEQTFYSDSFSLTRQFYGGVEGHEAKNQCVFFKYGANLVTLKEADDVPFLEYKPSNATVPVSEDASAMSLDDLAQRVYDILGIKKDEKPVSQ